MRALVTGASGMLGCHLVSRLLERGWEVVGLVRPGSLSRRPWASDLASRIKLVEADLLDRGRLAKVLGGSGGFDAVFHTAAILSARGRRMYRVNYGGTVSLLEALRGVRIGVFVYVSSILALGDTLRETAEEDAACRPRTSYERSKCDSERLVLKEAGQMGYRAVIVRPTWIYGEYTRNPDIPRLLSMARMGVVPVLVSRDHPVSLVYAGDVAEAMIRLVESGAQGIYNVRGPRMYTSLELAEALASAVGRRRFLGVRVPRPLLGLSARFMDIVRFLLLAPPSIPVERLVSATGFAPSMDLGEGLRRTAEWLRSKTGCLSGSLNA